MLLKPMRALEGDEIFRFIEVDERPITEQEIKDAKKSIKVYKGIKPRKLNP